MKKRKLLHFIIVGGGATGIEFTSELKDFIDEDLKKSFPELLSFIKVTLIEAGKRVLGGFHEPLAAYAMKQLFTRKVNIITDTRVKEVREGELELATGEVIKFGLCVWSTGIAPPVVLRELQDFPKDKSGRLITDEFLRVKNKESIFAIGDCAVWEVNPQANAATAQAASQKGAYLAKILNKIENREKIEPFAYHHKGMLAYVGNYRAISETPALEWTGFSSFLFWRSAYFTNLLSFKNKFLVPMHWLKSFIFGRDISFFK